MREYVIHKNKKRKLIKVVDKKNRRFKYVREYSNGARVDMRALHPADNNEHVWHNM